MRYYTHGFKAQYRQGRSSTATTMARGMVTELTPRTIPRSPNHVTSQQPPGHAPISKENSCPYLHLSSPSLFSPLQRIMPYSYRQTLKVFPIILFLSKIVALSMCPCPARAVHAPTSPESRAARAWCLRRPAGGARSTNKAAGLRSPPPCRTDGASSSRRQKMRNQAHARTRHSPSHQLTPPFPPHTTHTSSTSMGRLIRPRRRLVTTQPWVVIRRHH